MCSILGIYFFKKSIDSLLIDKIGISLDSLHRRGPDEKYIIQVSNNCIMAGNRLAIRTAINNDTMPFQYKEHVCIYNGEIYNYKNWSKSANNDGEIILPAFIKQGFSVFKEFDGEFAISIYDKKKNRIILARDQFGTKPLYFALDNECIIWASSANAIHLIKNQIICQSVKSSVYHHTMSVQEPYTSYSNIWLLPPGHLLTINFDEIFFSAFNKWNEGTYNSDDCSELFKSVEDSLLHRLKHTDTIAIPMSGGIDSGIIAFYADKIGVPYEIFSVIEMLGEEIKETKYINKRIERLKNAKKVNLIKVGYDTYNEALQNIYLPNYYDSAFFDSGAIPTYALYKTINERKIKVAIDGVGGDELCHGYKFRDQFTSLDNWPKNWEKCNYYYSLYTTLLNYTQKSDRAGGFFSIESRFPFQTVSIYNAAKNLQITNELKWPLRKYLLEFLDYGESLKIDRNLKVGFSLKNAESINVIEDMQKAWLKANNLREMPIRLPNPFPFTIAKNKIYRNERNA